MKCEICTSTTIKESTFEILDDHASGNDLIVCTCCLDKLYHDTKAVVTVICKMVSAACIKLRWKGLDED